ncbi:MAG: hypothetical protein GC164_08360 [Phycisphaera sp.]|nr:hypothetical protein [Phycisphaera sp.]
MLQPLWAITRNTLTESIRQPVYVVLLLVGILAYVLLPSLAANTLDDDNKLMIDMGLSTLLLIGLFLAAFTATGVVSAEVDNKTVLSTLSKPVSRPLFILGKFLGVFGAIVLACWGLGAVFMLIVRHKVMMTAGDKFDQPVIFLGVSAGLLALVGSILVNYLYRWVFTSTFAFAFVAFETVALLLVLVIDKQWQFQSPLFEFGKDGAFIGGQVLIALLMVVEALAVLTAVAIAASTRLGQVMTLIVCLGVFVLGLWSQGFFAPHVRENPAAAALFYAIPNLHYTWTADAITQGLPLTGEYVLMVSAYSTLMVLAILSLAVALFQTREVG